MKKTREKEIYEYGLFSLRERERERKREREVKTERVWNNLRR